MILFFVSAPAYAQFSKAKLQATGLTCALCSRSIHQALDKIDFIDSVQPELKTSSFDIRFKEGIDVSVEAIRLAVEDAGFFVGGLTLVLTRNLSSTERSDRRFQQGAVSYQLLEDWKEGESLQVIGKGFLVEKELKRFMGRYADRMKDQNGVVYLLSKKK